MAKQRLDVELVSRQMATGREQAKRMIMAGEVFIKGRRAEKPSQSVLYDDEITIKSNAGKYVSRGGYKLEKALAVFDVDVNNKTVVDIGASTGGFTDCLLKNGAKKVYSVDVGYGQLDYKLRTNEKVVVMERTNARYLELDNFSDTLEFFVMDVSFISVKLILPAIFRCVSDKAEGAILVKPQFEAGRENVGKNGVVRDSSVHEKVIVDTMEYARNIGFKVKNIDFSPVKGPEGNIEFLMHLSKQGQGVEVNAKKTVKLAHDSLILK